MSDITNYENLANAIVLQAVKDYRVALKCLVDNPKNKMALADKHEVEHFFRSGWFSVLTSLDGEMLIRSLREDVGI
ncbi:MAG: hypothetical protein ACOX7O_10330 [Oscillospiraceae bacterium]|mgnify:CR=1|jgi:hypothetical protein